MNKNKYKVAHDINEINEGVDIVFTIKDKGILEGDENDGMDILENVNLKQNKFYKKNVQKKMNLSGTENSFGYEKKDMLDKYDIEHDEMFYIGNNNQANEDYDMNEDNQAENDINAESEINNIKARLTKLKGGNESKGIKVALNADKKFASDYMTNEEYKSQEFKKTKSSKNKKINKPVLTSKDSLLLDNNNEDIIMQNHEREYITKKGKIREKVYDEYDELNIFLEKQRNLINKEKQKDMHEKILKELLDSTQKPEIFGENKNENAEEITETTEFLKKVSTKQDIEENYRMLTTPVTYSLKDTKNGSVSVVNIPLPNERRQYKLNKSLIEAENQKFLANKTQATHILSLDEKDKVVEDNQKNSTSWIETEITIGNTIQDENIEEKWEEPPVGKGIAVALQVLRKRGLVGRKNFIGRHKDKINTTNDYMMDSASETEKSDFKTRFLSNLNKAHEIEIEHRDNRGKLLKPKESFRHLSYAFHGKGPSKDKIEKQMLKEQIEDKIRNQDPMKSSKTFNHLKNHQKKTGSAHVVLQGKNI